MLQTNDVLRLHQVIPPATVFKYVNDTEYRCEQFLRWHFRHTLRNIEYIEYDGSPENKRLQKKYGDFKLTLYNNKVIWVESKGRLKWTDDISFEVRKVGGEWHIAHDGTDYIYFEAPNHKPVLIDVLALRELWEQNPQWHTEVHINDRKDGYCGYLNRKEYFQAKARLLGEVILN